MSDGMVFTLPEGTEGLPTQIMVRRIDGTSLTLDALLRDYDTLRLDLERVEKDAEKYRLSHSELCGLIATLRLDLERKQRALEELIACKELKDAVESILNSPGYDYDEDQRANRMDDDYVAREPLAWQAARLAAAPSEGE